MVTTADDWTYIRSLLAITEQGNIAVDLVAQTLENLNIYLTGAETIPVDILTQTLENLKIEIAANTIGNIPINLNQQGMGDVLMNIDAQNIDRVIIRDHDGGLESSGAVHKLCSTMAETLFHTKSGKGTLKSFYIYAEPGADSHKIKPRIYIDGTMMKPEWTFTAWSLLGANASSRPFQLLQHSTDGICVGAYWFEKGIVFDTSVSLRVFNESSSNEVHVDGYWFYQLIPP